MLFYNHKHEFIGIDEEGLKLLNYQTMEGLLEVCGDVADLFAKEPGYIHNFKSFGWIDFLLHADSDARSAIVHGNGRIFSCTLVVHKFFLCEAGDQNGYMIDMTQVKSISGDDIQPVKPVPYALKETKEFTPPPPKETVNIEILPDYAHITPQRLNEPDTLDVPSFVPASSSEDFNEEYLQKLTLPLSEEELHEPEETPVPEPETPPQKIERPMLGDVYYSNAEQGFIDSLKVSKDYHYDPHVAAQELGLPVDLIEEFIGDFIQQSYEFKDELFEALAKNDINNVKILSHKLKGVAANLRIEDSFETLSIINTSNDLTEIEANLKYFYALIGKLEGKEIPQHSEKIDQFNEVNEALPPLKEASPLSSPDGTDDIYTLALKSDAPESITIAEPETLSYEPDIEISLKPLEEEVSPVAAYEPEPEAVIDMPVEYEENTIEPEESTPDMSAPIRYDRNNVAGSLGIDREFLDVLIDEYKHDALIAARAMMAAIGAFDTHGWKHTAAELKGISDNLRLSEISEELAILSRTNDAQEANKASKRLNGYLDQL